MKINYKHKRFTLASVAIIEKANSIIEAYGKQGYDLTLRQLYYQFVARDLIKNDQKEYKRLGSIINDARLAGMLSWEAIVDRTRNLQSNSHWSGPRSIVESCAAHFRLDCWNTQPTRVEVWIEKDALIGVIAGVCDELDVPYFSCRGYTSQSEMWAASQRLIEYTYDCDDVVIIHLGDHDPSGIDMTRDINDRLNMFMEHEGAMVDVERIALNMNQIKKYNPPPNPAKTSDVRATKYIKKYGNNSWELDALEPKVLEDLVRKTILKHRDDELWDVEEQRQLDYRNQLREIAEGLD